MVELVDCKVTVKLGKPVMALWLRRSKHELETVNN